MNTPTEMNRSSASSSGSCLGEAVRDRQGDRALGRAEHLHGLGRVLIVTLLNITVAGFTIRFGSSTARRPLTPSFWLVSVIADGERKGG
jgi:hypothetical protein